MTARAYYNEVNEHAVGWLRNLVAAGLIPDGDVDCRSIVDVRPDDLAGYTQCHFFAGIGGWAYACRLASWPEDRPIWTGSCPCQPFSVAGKGAGVDDVRHLWPDFFRLIRACRPVVVVGEQVAGKAGYGWLDGVRADLESEDYASRGIDIPACAVDAPHRRSRLYWLALADTYRRGRAWRQKDEIWREIERTAAERADARGMEHAPCIGRRKGRPEPEIQRGRAAIAGADAPSVGVAMGDADGTRLAIRRSECGDDGAECATAQRTDGSDGTFWSGAEWIVCHDGKARRTKPGLPLLAHGIRARVAKWRGLGNAIVPQEAAQVIGALMDIMP